MTKLNSTAACVLGILDVGPPPPEREHWSPEAGLSGAEAWSALERSVAGFWSMTRSQVYQELKHLVGAGLADKTGDHYAINAAGRSAVGRWFHDFALAEPRDEQVRSPIALSVFFGHYLPPALLDRVVREHRLRYQRRYDTLQTIQAALEGDQSLPGSTLQRAMIYLGGAIDWTNDVIARLAAPQTAPPRRRRRPPARTR